MFWVALGFCIVAIVGSIAYAVARAWRLWRTFRATSRRASDALGRVTAAAAEAERHATSLSGGTERLAAATASLQESLAELHAIRAAVAEPLALLGSIRGVVPRK
jgi:hypothetical protein